MFFILLSSDIAIACESKHFHPDKEYITIIYNAAHYDVIYLINVNYSINEHTYKYVTFNIPHLQILKVRKYFTKENEKCLTFAHWKIN